MSTTPDNDEFSWSHVYDNISDQIEQKYGSHLSKTGGLGRYCGGNRWWISGTKRPHVRMVDGILEVSQYIDSFNGAIKISLSDPDYFNKLVLAIDQI